jgi:hypothetical protein
MNSINEINFYINIVLNFQFWAIIPALNININSRELEFEWLCLGIYLGLKNG